MQGDDGGLSRSLTSGNLKGTYIKRLKRYVQIGMTAGSILGSWTDVPEPIEALQDTNRSLRRELAENQHRIDELQEMVKDLQRQVLMARSEAQSLQPEQNEGRKTHPHPLRLYAELEMDDDEDNNAEEHRTTKEGQAREGKNPLPAANINEENLLQKLQTMLKKDIAAECERIWQRRMPTPPGDSCQSKQNAEGTSGRAIRGEDSPSSQQTEEPWTKVLGRKAAKTNIQRNLPNSRGTRGGPSGNPKNGRSHGKTGQLTWPQNTTRMERAYQRSTGNRIPNGSATREGPSTPDCRGLRWSALTHRGMATHR